MADLPIPLSPPIVRAILREIRNPGTGKSQMRREMASQPQWSDAGWVVRDIVYSTADLLKSRAAMFTRYHGGDRLWVREAWRAPRTLDDLSPAEICEEGKPVAGSGHYPVLYNADQHFEGSWQKHWQNDPPGRFRQARQMPRWASRITLIITEVRIQRLLEISVADARAEGIQQFDNIYALERDQPLALSQRDPRDAFVSLWDAEAEVARNDENPWVAAYSFRPILGNIDQVTP